MVTKKQETTEQPKDPLIHQCFHSLKDGKIQWQGYVIGSPAPGLYYVQLFEWLMGDPSTRKLVKLEDMMDWLFYPDDEAMKFSYEHGVASGIKRRSDKKDDGAN